MRWLPAISGAAATAGAAVVLVSLGIHPGSIDTEAEAVAPPEGGTIVFEMPTETAAIESPVETTIAGLDPVLSRALVATGHADRFTPSELTGQLDPIVTQALAESDAVLVIPDTGGG